MEHLLQKSTCSIFHNILKEQMLHLHNIFKYMAFQRRQKELLWSKRFKKTEGS